MVAKVSSAHSFINGRQELPTHTFILSPGQNQESWEALSQLKTTTLYGRGDRLGICQECHKWHLQTSKRTIEMLEVYILPLKKPGLRHLSRLSKKVEHTL